LSQGETELFLLVFFLQQTLLTELMLLMLVYAMMMQLQVTIHLIAMLV
jgi:hypothetical protein